MKRCLFLNDKTWDHLSMYIHGLTSNIQQFPYKWDHLQGCQLTWIFPGDPLTLNRAPGNIQGNLDRYASYLWWEFTGTIGWLYLTEFVLKWSPWCIVVGAGLTCQSSRSQRRLVYTGVCSATTTTEALSSIHPECHSNPLDRTGGACGPLISLPIGSQGHPFPAARTDAQTARRRTHRHLIWPERSINTVCWWQ